jgi:membrane fusion protein, multidrug efflux system
VRVPVRAVQINDQAASVMIVGANGTATLRPVQLGGQLGDSWIIRGGLRPGERVIIDGWQKVRPGQKVDVRAPGQRPAAAPAAK